MMKHHPSEPVLLRLLRNAIRMILSGIEKKDLTDEERVCIASRLLNISEFRFFQISYFRWYGREISEKEIEPFFTTYIMNGLVPHWVRHFSREVLSRYLQGSLDPGEYNIQCKIPPVQIREPFGFLPFFLTMFYLFVYFVASGNIAVR